MALFCISGKVKAATKLPTVQSLLFLTSLFISTVTTAQELPAIADTVADASSMEGYFNLLLG